MIPNLLFTTITTVETWVLKDVVGSQDNVRLLGSGFFLWQRQCANLGTLLL